ncbi:MAG: Wzz/FepE/Etk N-terminal domain-containing protein [Methanothrix sp.]|uniref:Wzz/FepE/Etk N-terminal domain-containing protein n=2 Tax=Methanothrix sp. TaxID=90426 RepID=UPI003C78ABF5
MDEMDDEIDLRDIFLVLWKNRLMIAAVFMIAVIAAGAVSFMMPSVYRASCIVALGDFGDPMYTTQSAASEIMTSDAFVLDLLSRLNLSLSPGEFAAFKDSMWIEPVKGSDRLLSISMETTDPDDGARILREMVSLFADRSNQSYSERRGLLVEELAATSQLLDSVEESINQTRQAMKEIEGATGVSPLEKSLLLSYKLDYLQNAESQRLSLMDRCMNLQKQLMLMKSVEIVEAPAVPLQPVKPKRTLILAVAGMLGLMLGVFAAFLRDALSKEQQRT